jgi:S-DNA-T family DNA segregation ATPase FtsK/SpoIIIE
VPGAPARIGSPPIVPVPPNVGVIQTLFPVVGGVGLLGFAIAFGNSVFLYIALVMIVLMLGFSLAMRWSQRRGVRKRAAADARRYAAYLRERDDELAEAGDLQRRALARLYPDPGKLWTAVLKRRGIWERRPDHPDFMHVRFGRGNVPLDRAVELELGVNPLTEYQAQPLQEARRLVERRGTLRGEPLVEDLSDVGVLAVTGDRARTRGFARALMTQLAAFRAPRDLRLGACFDASDSGEWDWAKWLPHQRAERHSPGRGADRPVLAFARTPLELDALLDAELRPRLEQLRRMAESGIAGRDVQMNAHKLVLVVDCWRPDHFAADLPSFRQLLATARELEALVVLLTDERELEPPETGARLSVPAHGTASFERAGPNAPRIERIALDEVDTGTAEAIARALTPLRLEEGGDGARGLTADVRLVDLLGLQSAAALDPARSQAPRPRSQTLRAAIGVRADGELLELDLKQAAEGGMGPHGILVGATGSGKSELLRTLVAGLAANHDPESLAFVLVDYKGGAAFAELARLPHTAGLITNLQSDLTLVDRMRDALVGEQERRQSLLRLAGDLDDIVAYRARREADSSLPPMPNLLVIVDEFAELLAARPEFIDLFVSLGRVGRSLGIHLLLSSQRLDEGRLRGLESHLRYRICLRTYSATESKIVIGTPDAYLLPSVPGMGFLKVDTEIYTQFRAALSTSPHHEPEEDAVLPAVDVLEFEAGAAGALAGAQAGAGDAPPGPQAGVPTDLEVLVERLARGTLDAPPVHQVWLPPLEPERGLAEVMTEEPWWTAEPVRDGLALPVGMLDLPTQQRIEPHLLDLSGTGGHVAVVGAPRTGKSTLLRTIIASAVRRYTPDQVRFYAVDLGGGGLFALEGAPHVGGVTGKLDREAVERVVHQLRGEIEDREAAFARLRVESMAQIRSMGAAGELDGDEGELADVFLVIDGWAAFKSEFLELDREVERIAASGLSYGVHVMVTANRWADMRSALLDNFGTRLELRLNDPIDSDVSRAAAASVPAGVPGRGITSAGTHFQAALPRFDGERSSEDLSDAVRGLAEEADGHWRRPAAEPIRLLPRELDPSELPAPRRDAIAIGVEERRLEPVLLDPVGGDPHLLVFGDAETGKSSLLRLLARGIAATSEPDEAQLVLVDVRRSLADLADLPHVREHPFSPPAVASAIEDIRRLLEPRVPGATGQPAAGGPRIYLLFDDYDLSSGPTSTPLAPLLDLLPLGREIGLHVVLARRVAGSARGAYEAGFQRVRELGSPGLIMSGDAAEGPLVGGEKARSLPPGRGLFVRRGGPAVVVQTAFAAPTPVEADQIHDPESLIQGRRRS